MSFNTDLLLMLCKNKGIILSKIQIEKFSRYAALLDEWNEKINLTRITEPDEVTVKHFYDSIMPLVYCELNQGATLADVGSGAGFPVIPIAILRPDLKITMIDSLKKRVSFLQIVCTALEIPGAAYHLRAEEAGQGQMRAKFDYVCARAVAPLNVLAEYCVPLLKSNGRFIALKGYECDEEVHAAGAAVATLNAQIIGKEKFLLDEMNKRAIVVIEKISQTPTKYPRNSKEIAKRPL